MAESEPLVSSNDEEIAKRYKKAWQQHDSDIPMQLHRSNLPLHLQLTVFQFWETLKQKESEAQCLASWSMRLGILQSGCGAVVPVLIGFGTRSTGISLNLFGSYTTDLAEFLETLAAIVSLFGALCGVILGGYKLPQRAHVKNKHVEVCQMSVRRFAAKSGKYAQFDTHTEAYPHFMHEVHTHQEMHSESKFFEGLSEGGYQGPECKLSVRTLSNDRDSGRICLKPDLKGHKPLRSDQPDESDQTLDLINQKVEESLRTAAVLQN